MVSGDTSQVWQRSQHYISTLKLSMRVVESELNYMQWSKKILMLQDSHVEAPHGNNATIVSLIDKLDCEIKGLKMIQAAFHRHFTQLFGRSKKLKRG